MTRNKQRPHSVSVGRPHLGVGWPFPVRPSSGALSPSRYEQSIEEAITVILQTTPGERVMEPGFGVGLRSFVFASNSATNHRLIENEVVAALRDFEPRIKVESVRASQSPEGPNRLNIEIDYVVRRSNAFYNRVFPFYLREAG